MHHSAQRADKNPSDLCRQVKQELNAIDHVIADAKRGAENQCQKFKSGHVQWCPRITTTINKILFWKSILKCETGGKVGLTILHSRAHKARVDYVLHKGEYPVKTLQEFISTAYKQFRHLKSDNTQRDTWIAQLISAHAAAWNQTKKTLWKQLQSTEQIQMTAQNVQNALHKPTLHKPLSVVTAPGPVQGLRQEMHQKVNMEKACLAKVGC